MVAYANFVLALILISTNAGEKNMKKKLLLATLSLASVSAIPVINQAKDLALSHPVVATGVAGVSASHFISGIKDDARREQITHGLNIAGAASSLWLLKKLQDTDLPTAVKLAPAVGFAACSLGIKCPAVLLGLVKKANPSTAQE